MDPNEKSRKKNHGKNEASSVLDAQAPLVDAKKAENFQRKDRKGLEEGIGGKSRGDRRRKLGGATLHLREGDWIFFL